jgi:sulfoxide reductase heme-binding subunit YedZ
MQYPWWRLLLFLIAASVPCYWVYLGSVAALGPDPGKVLVDNLGQGALVLLLCSLSMTPLQRLTSWPGWIAFRRQLGLWSFGYAVLHVAAYLYFLLGLDFTGFTTELVERPYIAVGAIALLGLSTLAATSTRWSMRKLGKRWKKLHRIVYPIVLVVLLHMLWVVRADAGRWSLYATVAVVLLLLRLPFIERKLGGHGRVKRVRSIDGNKNANTG